MIVQLNKVIGLVYDRLPSNVQNEITVYTTIVLAAVNLLQESALPLSSAVHAGILVVTVVAGALGVRGSVTPLSKQ